MLQYNSIKTSSVINFGELHNIIKLVINFTGFFILHKWLPKVDSSAPTLSI